MKVKEIWKDIPGYEGLYQVSNLGNVKSLPRIVRANTCGIRVIPEKLLTPCKNNAGYFLVVLCKNGKHKSINVHRLVALSFILNPNNLNEVNHKNEIKTDNRVCNLEWCDRRYNSLYGTGVERCSRKKWKKIAMIDAVSHEVLKVYSSLKQASLETGISNKNISSAANNKSRTAGGFEWKFI